MKINIYTKYPSDNSESLDGNLIAEDTYYLELLLKC